jgi:hypothetical protein
MVLFGISERERRVISHPGLESPRPAPVKGLLDGGGWQEGWWLRWAELSLPGCSWGHVLCGLCQAPCVKQEGDRMASERETGEGSFQPVHLPE